MDNHIDIQEVMKTIKSQLQNDHKTESIQFMADYPDGYIPSMEEAIAKLTIRKKKESLDFVRTHMETQYYREIENKNGCIVILKRAIRKAIAFVVKPILNDINNNNKRIVEVIESQDFEIQLLKKELSDLKSKKISGDCYENNTTSSNTK